MSPQLPQTFYDVTHPGIEIQKNDIMVTCFICLFTSKCFAVFYVFSFPPGVYVGTLNLIASIHGLSICVVMLGQSNG